MVVWVFAGGGEAELRGLSIFLRANFPALYFELKTPIRKKPGPRPNHNPYHALGYTGTSLRQQIHYLLEQALRDGVCECILMLDDLDCHDLESSIQAFDETIRHVSGAEDIPSVISFASPEIEAWLIADWRHSFEKHYELKPYQVNIRRALAEEYRNFTRDGDINHPESFSLANADGSSCKHKLSERIAEIVRINAGVDYSKDEHSGSMLQNVRAEIIQQHCPIFRRTLYAPLSSRNATNVNSG